MTLILVAALNLAFAAALVAGWAYAMASTRRRLQAPTPARTAEHVLDMEHRRPRRVAEPVAA